MQLYIYRKTSSEFCSAFPKSTDNFELFGKKYEPQRLFASELLARKNRDYLNV